LPQVEREIVDSTKGLYNATKAIFSLFNTLTITNQELITDVKSTSFEQDIWHTKIEEAEAVIKEIEEQLNATSRAYKTN
jgi:hypothetical protein